MNISDLITRLENLRQLHGDLAVTVFTEVGGGSGYGYLDVVSAGLDDFADDDEPHIPCIVLTVD